MYDFKDVENIQSGFYPLILMSVKSTDYLSSEVYQILTNLIIKSRFDSLCFSYENLISKGLAGADDSDEKFGDILDKNLSRLLLLTSKNCPSDNTLCYLLEISLKEVIRWQVGDSPQRGDRHR